MTLFRVSDWCATTKGTGNRERVTGGVRSTDHCHSSPVTCHLFPVPCSLIWHHHCRVRRDETVARSPLSPRRDVRRRRHELLRLFRGRRARRALSLRRRR